MRTRWIVTVIASAAAAIGVMAAPVERTLGPGIRSVYVHVSLTWAGLAVSSAFVFAALAAAIAFPRRFEGPLNRMYLCGLVLVALGFGSSFVAADANWGAIQWTEPRTVAVMKVLIGMGGAWLVLWPLASRPRFRFAALAAVTGTLLGWLYVVPRVLHPETPVGTSESGTIKTVFYGLTLLWLAVAAVWIAPARASASRREAVPESMAEDG